MNLNVITKNPMVDYYLEDLSDNKIYFTNGEDISVPPGWYNFILKYTSEHNEIEDIKINGETIGHYLHTGFFTEESTGKQYQPANAVWTDGFYSIWIYTELGFMDNFLINNITDGDFGINKFNSYLHTVDKSIDIDPIWPERIRSYYRAANGPGWWRKDTGREPYISVPPEQVDNIDRQKILHDIDLDCKISEPDYFDVSKYGKQDGVRRFVSRKTIKKQISGVPSNQPWMELKELKNKELVKLCEQIGVTRILNVLLQTLPSGGSFWPHRDNLAQYHSDALCQFMLNLQEKGAEKNLFKLGTAGLIPMNDGTFFNNRHYSHCSINDSNYHRHMLIIHGDRGNVMRHAQ
jgi:hypothetical protein